MKEETGQHSIGDSWQGAVRAVTAELPVMELRQVGQEAAGLLASLHHAAFAGREHWDEAAFSQIMAMPGVVAWLACIGEGGADGATSAQLDSPSSVPSEDVMPVGFIISRNVVDEGEILSLGVHPYWRRRGLARKLLHHVVQQAKLEGQTLFLEVRLSNQAAIALYGQAGFKQVAVRPRYYDDGEDARLLRYVP